MVFTWNTYPDVWREKLEKFFNDIDCSVMIAEEEQEEETGREHIQGYFHLNKRTYRNTLIARFGK